MAPKPSMRRVPLAAREVHIIRRLKKVVKLPVTTIALATERNKTTIYSALDQESSHLKPGPGAQHKYSAQGRRFVGQAPGSPSRTREPAIVGGTHKGFAKDLGAKLTKMLP